jgi:hypothetical protein
MAASIVPAPRFHERRLKTSLAHSIPNSPVEPTFRMAAFFLEGGLPPIPIRMEH